MTSATWYFDFVSPYAYLQSRLLDRFAGKLQLTLVPVLFAGLLDHWKNMGPAEIAPKRLWTYRFCTWFARRHGIPFAMPPRHPFPPLKPLRLAVALNGNPAAVHAIFAHIWAEGRDPSDGDGWRALVEKVGIADADALCEQPEVKAKLRANTEAAVRAGVFGVPSFLIGREVFWGVDATDFALQYLADPQLFDEPAFARIASVPSGAERKR